MTNTKLTISVFCCLVTFIPSGVRPQLPSYEDDLSGYGDAAAASAPQMSGIDMLRMSVPGNPGQESDFNVLLKLFSSSEIFSGLSHLCRDS